MKYIFLILFLLIFIGCEEEKTEKSVCSIVNPLGECENDGEYCYKGGCIAQGATCEENQVMAPCLNPELVCEESFGTYSCKQKPCSSRVLDGYCPEGETCVYPGTCKKLCSETYQTGYCMSDGDVCIEGECLLESNLCSATNTEGLCPSGKYCVRGGCRFVCSQTHLDGVCIEDETVCLEGRCIDQNLLCSTTKPDGICPEGELCDQDGECKPLCSEGDPDGICENSEYICYQGECSPLCSQLAPNGVCTTFGDRCVSGECKSACSSQEINGYCIEDEQICVLGICVFNCSETHSDGYCENEMVCNDGSCKHLCSFVHPDGICLEDNNICQNGECIEGCSLSNPNGECPENDHYCNFETGECEEYPCGTVNPDGPCPQDDRRCVNGRCKMECSPEEPTGYCENLGWICNEGVCVDSAAEACSSINPEGECPEHFSCVDGDCIEDSCSVNYPTGRCDNPSEVCIEGICQVPDRCADGRPLNGDQGSCCLSDSDCVANGFSVFQNICMTTLGPNDEGYYCMEIAIFGLGNACQNDAQCNDPYPEYGTEQGYYCEQIYYSDQETGGQTIDIRACARNLENCEMSRDKDPGVACNSDCYDSECKFGSHCLMGMCTLQCDPSAGRFNNQGCPQINGEYLDCITSDLELPGMGKRYLVDVCAKSCKANNDCVIDGTECNQLADISNGRKHFVCNDAETSGGYPGSFCTIDQDCKSLVCNKKDKQCTSPCDDDGDCGDKAYCNFTYGIEDDQNRTTQYFGTCRYLDSSTTSTDSCLKDEDCPTNHNCLPKIGENGETMGVCGVLNRTYFNYANNGSDCNNLSTFCKSDICLDGKCREYCEATTDCEEDHICSATEIREETILNGVITDSSVYVGSCQPRVGSMEPCRDSITSCDMGETCIFNTTTLISSSDQIEYLCVASNSGGLPIGSDCQQDNECESHICHPEKHFCTIGCNSNIQCSGDFSFCNNDGYIVVDADNEANKIWAGICDNN